LKAGGLNESDEKERAWRRIRKLSLSKSSFEGSNQLRVFCFLFEVAWTTRLLLKVRKG
jgi:hypothetical protein